jgi:hypothetical protein
MCRDTGRFVTELRPEEPARFDPERLEDLCRRIGEVPAEAEVALALHRISDALTSLSDPDPARDAAVLRAALTALARDAGTIGMSTLALVSRHVLDCLDRGDARAFSATLARLFRVGERSLHAVWDLEDRSG